MKARTIALMSLTALLLCGMCICVSGDGESDVSADSSNAAVIVGTGTEYSTLEDAVSSNSGKFTIRMLRDVSDVGKIRITDGKDVTVDLNGFTIEFRASVNINNRYIFEIENGALTLTGDGVVTEKEGAFKFFCVNLYGGEGTKNYSHLTVDSGVILKGAYPVICNQNGKNSGMVVDFYGKAEATYAALYVNGQITNAATHVPEMNVYPGAVLESENGGIYAAGYAVWNIDGATITGSTGIEIRAGEMNISNSTITGTAKDFKVDPNPNGATTDGAGIAVAQHNTELNIDVTVDSSVVSGIYALYESNPQENPSDVISKVKISVKGGEFSAINGGTNAVHSDDCTEFISGGIFSSSPDDTYIAGGCTMSPISGKYCVSSVSSPGDAVNENSTIVNAGSSTTSTVMLPSASISIDGNEALGNVMISAIPRTFTEAPDAISSYEITIVTDASYIAYITVAAEIPYGHVPLVYYIDDDGNLMPVEVVSCTASTVTFKTTHTTPFIVMSEAGSVITPDDEDDDPAIPGQTTQTESSKDNTTTVVACAAAAVAAAMIAAFLLIDGRKP